MKDTNKYFKKKDMGVEVKLIDFLVKEHNEKSPSKLVVIFIKIMEKYETEVLHKHSIIQLQHTEWECCKNVDTVMCMTQ